MTKSALLLAFSALMLIGCGPSLPVRKFSLSPDPTRPAQILARAAVSDLGVGRDRAVVPPTPPGILKVFPPIPLDSPATTPVAATVSSDGETVAWVTEDGGTGRQMSLFAADGVVRTVSLPKDLSDLPLAVMLGKSSVYLVVMTWEPQREVRVLASDLRLSGWQTRLTRSVPTPVRFVTVDHRLPPTVAMVSGEATDTRLLGWLDVSEPNVRFVGDLEIPVDQIFPGNDPDELILVKRTSRDAAQGQIVSLLGGRRPEPVQDWGGHVPLWAAARVRMEPEALPLGGKPAALRYQLMVDLGPGRVSGTVRPPTKTAPDDLQILGRGASGAILSRGNRLEFLPWAVQDLAQALPDDEPTSEEWAEARRRQEQVRAAWGERFRQSTPPVSPARLPVEAWGKAGLTPEVRAELRWNAEPVATLGDRREDQAWAYPLAVWPRDKGTFLLFNDGVVWQASSTVTEP